MSFHMNTVINHKNSELVESNSVNLVLYKASRLAVILHFWGSYMHICRVECLKDLFNVARTSS